MNTFIFDIETSTSDNAEQFMPTFEDGKSKGSKTALDKESEWREKTPLSALTGKILCIGIRTEVFQEILMQDEPKIITAFWDFWIAHEKQDTLFIGHNIYNFDLPYLINRSWVNGIKPPTLYHKRYWNDNIIDTMNLWNANRYPKEMVSLKNLAKVLGVGDKTDDGKRFGELWNTDREKALEYVKNDLTLIEKIYQIIK